MSEKIAVLITTDNTKRGVFFGYIDPEDIHKDEIEVEQVQMCVMWSVAMHGVLGLAAIGPDQNCRISPPVERGIIRGVTFISECSKEAEKAWKKQPWKN